MQPIMGFGIPFIHLNSIKHQPGFVKVWPRITIGLWPKSLCRFWKVFRITSYCSWKGEAYVQPLGFQSLFMRNLWKVFAFKFPKKTANNVFDAYVSKPDKWNEAISKRKIIVTIRKLNNIQEAIWIWYPEVWHGVTLLKKIQSLPHMPKY